MMDPWASAVAFLLKHWKLIGIGALVVLLSGTTWRLNHAKGDLAQARAALVNPKTHRTWEQDFTASQRNLDICHQSVSDVQAALDTANGSIATLAAQGAARAKTLKDGLERAQKGRAGAERRALDLINHGSAGKDACARSEAAAKAVVSALR